MTTAGRDYDVKQSKVFSVSPAEAVKFAGSLNQFYKVEGYISLKDFASIEPPEYLPKDIEAAFREGAACYAIGSYNAASCMFRLCLDMLSNPLLPDPKNKDVHQPTDFVRRNLGARLSWLFKEGLLPRDLERLATSVRNDGNDGAHVGNLTKADCDDLIDFTRLILERLITEPRKLELAEARRAARREADKPS